MLAWTDFVFTEFNHKETVPPTFHKVEVLAYDGFNYCKIRYGDFVLRKEMHIAYLYHPPGPDGVRARLTKKELKHLKVVRSESGEL